MRERRFYEADPHLLDKDDDDDDDNSSSSSEPGECNWKVLTGVFIIQVCSCSSWNQNYTSYLSRSEIQAIKFVFHGFSWIQSIYKSCIEVIYIYAVQQNTQSFFNEWVYSSRVLARHVSDLTGPSSGSFYMLCVQIWYVVLLCVLLDTSSRYFVTAGRVE